MSDEAKSEEPAPERTWPHTVKLKHPVTFADERIAELTFQRGKLGDLKGLRLDRMPTVDELLLVASRMCGQPVKALEQLKDDDGPEVLAIAGGFFGRCL